MSETCVCGRPIKQVDLSGTPFFEHKPRRECLTWRHEDLDYFLTPSGPPPGGPRGRARRKERIMTDNQTPDAEALADIIDKATPESISDYRYRYALHAARRVIAAGWVSPERVGDLQASEGRMIAESWRRRHESADQGRKHEARRADKAEAEVARLTKFEREHHELERRWEEDARPAFHALGKAEAEVARLTKVLEGVRALAGRPLIVDAWADYEGDPAGEAVAARALRAVLDEEVGND